jgi:ankyrin repeat protein
MFRDGINYTLMMIKRRAAVRASGFACLLALTACGSNGGLDERLLRAATQGDKKKVAELIKRGAHVDVIDEDGWTPLLWASAHGNEGAVEALLEAGANRQAVTRREHQGPLILAGKWNRVEVVQTLLGRGFSIGQRDSIGWSALMWTSLQGRTDVVKALLDAGAPVETVDSDGNTPLILAARRGHMDTVRLLLARGARPEVRNVDGETAASLAAADDYPDVASLLKTRP